MTVLRVLNWRTVAAIAASLAIAIPAPVGDIGAVGRSGCGEWGSRQYAPPTIAVWVPHRHMIWRPTFRDYVLHVMSAGAAPAYLPDESLKAMALGISQYAWYEILHPSPHKVAPGLGCFDIKNGGAQGQYVWPRSGLRPWTPRQAKAYDAIAGWTAWKWHRGHLWMFRTGWRAGYGGQCGSGIDGWHLPEDEMTRCARKGWPWRRIVTTYLHKVVLRPPGWRNR